MPLNLSTKYANALTVKLNYDRLLKFLYCFFASQERILATDKAVQ